MNAPRIVVAALSVLMLSACVIAPYPRHPAYADAGYGEPIAVAEAPPPAPYVEVIPAIPFVGAVWLGGYWGWRAHRHHWVPGRWQHARPGYHWQPHRWAPANGRWHLYGGRWNRG